MSSGETPALQIRRAGVRDADRVAVLMHQLGYDAAATTLAARLQGRSDRREVFVAESAGGILGWVAVSVDEPFVEGLQAEVEGLIVDENARSDGIGAKLLRTVEEWARERGCTHVRVLTNVVRERAHAFYARHGYATVKAQYNLRKRL